MAPELSMAPCNSHVAPTLGYARSLAAGLHWHRATASSKSLAMRRQKPAEAPEAKFAMLPWHPVAHSASSYNTEVRYSRYLPLLQSPEHVPVTLQLHRLCRMCLWAPRVSHRFGYAAFRVKKVIWLYHTPFITLQQASL